MKFIIQSQNDCIQSQNECLQSIDRLEAKMSHSVKIINDRNEKTLPNTLLTIPDPLATLIGTKIMVSWRL